MKSQIDTPIWHRLMINRPELTGGTNLRDLLEAILKTNAQNVTKVVVSGVEGGGDPNRGITNIGCGRMSVEELLERLRFTKQLDWANLFFFTSVDDKHVSDICHTLSIPEAIAISTFSARVIDDSSIEIFSKDAILIKNVSKKYLEVKLQSGQLAEFDFPM